MVQRQSGYKDRFDYRVDLMRRRNEVTASLGGVVLARSERTILVDEQNHGLVFYFPRADVDMSALKPVPGRTTFCPYKGEAVYWRLEDGDEPVAWSYQEPFPEVAAICNMVAFYQDRATVSLGVAATVFDKQDAGVSGGGNKSS